MAEYINREDAINLFYPVDPENDGSDGCTIILKNEQYSSTDIESMLSELPAADVAEAIRCRDCIYPVEDGGYLWCMGHCVSPEDFCSRGNSICG